MKFAIPALLSLAGLIAPCTAALTRGYIQVKAPSWEKGANLSTLFDDYDGDIIASEVYPPLEVQIDLERAQTTDSDIEILNGFWTDLYRYFGVSARSRTDVDPYPGYAPYIYIGFINVQQTPDARVQQKENSFTACYPNGMQELPFQASAIWRYDPTSGGKLTPTILGLDGKELPVSVRGGWYEQNVGFSAGGTARNDEKVEFYFVPAA